jgi:hypothetical protein
VADFSDAQIEKTRPNIILIGRVSIQRPMLLHPYDLPFVQMVRLCVLRQSFLRVILTNFLVPWNNYAKNWDESIEEKTSVCRRFGVHERRKKQQENDSIIV